MIFSKQLLFIFLQLNKTLLGRDTYFYIPQNTVNYSFIVKYQCQIKSTNGCNVRRGHRPNVVRAFFFEIGAT